MATEHCKTKHGFCFLSAGWLLCYKHSIFTVLLERSNNQMYVHQTVCIEVPQPKLEVTLKGFLKGMKLIRKTGFYTRNKRTAIPASESFSM